MADDDVEQIELFVITVYPGTGMPAIFLPRPEMAGGEWDSSHLFVILTGLDSFPAIFLME